jgi:protein gp37
MLNKTKIDFTDYVWNPVTGCNHGCPYCYARKMANRLRGRCGYPADEPFKPTLHDDKLVSMFPSKPSKIFVCSMGDLFADDIPVEWINDVLRRVKHNRQHTFIFLTKNPARYSEFDFPQNAWIGYSITGNLYHKWDIRHQDNIKFVSLEPMAEPMHANLGGYAQRIDFHWLIIGKETGNRIGKYIVTPEMLMSTIEFARKVGIKIFVKDSMEGYFGEMFVDALKVRPQECP